MWERLLAAALVVTHRRFRGARTLHPRCPSGPAGSASCTESALGGPSRVGGLAACFLADSSCVGPSPAVAVGGVRVSLPRWLGTPGRAAALESENALSFPAPGWEQSRWADGQSGASGSQHERPGALGPVGRTGRGRRAAPGPGVRAQPLLPLGRPHPVPSQACCGQRFSKPFLPVHRPTPPSGLAALFGRAGSVTFFGG